MKTVTALVEVPSSGTLQPIKTVTIQNNGLTTISPSSGYDGMEQVNATININHNNQISYFKLYDFLSHSTLVDTFDFDDMISIQDTTTVTINSNQTLIWVLRTNYGYDIGLMCSYNGNVTAGIESPGYYKIFDGNNTDLEIYNSEDLIIGEVYVYGGQSIMPDPIEGRTYIRDSYYDQAMIGQITNYPITSNGSINIPIPVPYSVVDQISLDVNVNSKIYVDRIGYEGTVYLFSNFSINTSDSYITVPAKYMFFNFVVYNSNYRYKCLVNNTNGNINIRPFVNTNTNIGYYIVANYSSTVVESVTLKTSNGDSVITITDELSDSMATTGYVYKQFIEFVLPS